MPARFAFEWNPYADQPHNVAPRSERRRHHFRHWRTYFSLVGSNLVHGLPALPGYRRNMRRMFRDPVLIERNMFGVSVSPPAPGHEDEVVALLKKTGAGRTLVRAASWERDRLADLERFVKRLRDEGFDAAIAVLQRRQDVFEPSAWRDFLEEAFARLSSGPTVFEIGHAWNRTKWGIWDYTEYLELARPAFELRPKYGALLAGPAVIDFEFHLYPPTLRKLPFDAVTSLLYVDRVGAPENPQFGWTGPMKIALFKAVSDKAAGRPRPCWITEVNWPLQGTGRYSPASGKPNVTEEEQADFLVRYHLLALAGGLIERVYWWQLVAPGYGLVDSREAPWRARPAHAALRTLIGMVSGSTFTGATIEDGAHVFRFEKEGRRFAACWTSGRPVERIWSEAVAETVGRDGSRLEPAGSGLTIEGSPKYVFFA
jgi:hypothetical protein